MATDTETRTSATEIIDALQKGEQSAVKAVQRFVESVDDALPDADPSDDPARRKIIESAFRMVDELITTSNDFARNVIKSSEHSVDE